MNPDRLGSNFITHAQTFGQRIAIAEPGGRKVTYAELSSHISATVDELTARGIGEGYKVAVLKEKSIDTVITFLALLECNATYIPIDPAIPAERIRQILADCDPDAFISDEKLFPTELHCEMDMCDALGLLENTVITLFTSGKKISSGLAYVLYTSGSTGTPKGVCVSHPAALAFVNWAKNALRLHRDDRVASIAPFHFDLSIFDIYVTLFTGATLHLFSSEQIRNARLMAHLMSENRITVIYATPSFFTALLLFGKTEKHQWASLRSILFAGEVFPVQHLHGLIQIWNNAKFFNLYGPTETNVCTWTAIRKEESRTHPYPIGIPCEGHQFEISPEGELIIGGPHVAEGYLDKPELTEARFFTRDNMRWFRTGDVVELDANRQLVYKGRIDRMIKRRGYRIEPAEVERVLLLHPNVTSCALVDVKGTDDLPLLIAYVVGEDVPDIITVKQFLLNYLPEYMLPDKVETIAVLPLTSTGKTDYLQLREFHAGKTGKE